MVSLDVMPEVNAAGISTDMPVLDRRYVTLGTQSLTRLTMRRR